MLNPNSVPSAPRLSEILFERREPSFASLAALPSNVDAIEAALLFSIGRNRHVVIVGPSGWGKTHLMRAVAHRLSCDGTPVEPMSAQQYVTSAACFDSSAPLVLDDVQDTLTKARQRLGLRIALERRIKANRPTILSFTNSKPNREIVSLLPSQRDWVIETMGEPMPAERVLVLDQMAKAEGLRMSPRLVRLLSDQMHGNGRTLSGALKRLRLFGVNWLDTPSTLRALGILEPFFRDNSSWDLKHRILRLAERNRAQFGKVNWLDLALYAMQHEAGLCEGDVARAANLSNGEVYQRTLRFQQQVEACDETAAYAMQFVELVVSSLARD